MSDWKCEILTEPSNGQESYSPALEQGYLAEASMLQCSAAAAAAVIIGVGNGRCSHSQLASL